MNQPLKLLSNSPSSPMSRSISDLNESDQLLSFVDLVAQVQGFVYTSHWLLFCIWLSHIIKTVKIMCVCFNTLPFLLCNPLIQIVYKTIGLTKQNEDTAYTTESTLTDHRSPFHTNFMFTPYTLRLFTFMPVNLLNHIFVMREDLSDQTQKFNPSSNTLRCLQHPQMQC